MLRRMFLRFRCWCLGLLRCALSQAISLTTTGSVSEVLIVRIDDGTRAGHVYRHPNIGRAEHEDRDGASFLVLTDYWGNRVAEYRSDLIRYTRSKRARVLDQIRTVQVVRS